VVKNDIKWQKSRVVVMFRGIHAINIDAKGRISVPVKYRTALLAKKKGQLVLTIDTDQRCLLLYPLAQWEAIEEKIIQLPSFDSRTRRIQRLLIGHATELNLDKSSRILVPALLRDYAQIKERLILVGQGHKFELWSEMHWNASRESWLSKTAEGENGIPDALKEISL
jgi:MraZ protein